MNDIFHRSEVYTSQFIKQLDFPKPGLDERLGEGAWLSSQIDQHLNPDLYSIYMRNAG